MKQFIVNISISKTSCTYPISIRSIDGQYRVSDRSRVHDRLAVDVLGEDRPVLIPGDRDIDIRWCSLNCHTIAGCCLHQKLWKAETVSIYTYCWKLDVFVKHGCPRWQQSQNIAKSLSPTFWPLPTPGACDVSDVWATLRWTCSPSLVTVSPLKLVILHFISGMELRTKQPNGRTDRRTFQAGSIKN